MLLPIHRKIGSYGFSAKETEITPKEPFAITLNFKNVLPLQALLLPNGLIPSRRMTKFSRRAQSKFASEIKKCRHLGLIPNFTSITV
ncbi:MAG: hypothetical protein ACTS6G_03110 [Candidatus Hodgkinia cicadicola]